MAKQNRKPGKIWNNGNPPHNWKGDKVSLGGLHAWLGKHLGQPNYCAYCQTTDIKKAKVFQWANISHTYKRDFNDFIRLCAKCHKRYDLGRLTLNIDNDKENML